MRQSNGQGPHQCFKSAHWTSPGDSSSIVSPARAESKQQVFKGRLGSSFSKFYLFCHSMVGLELNYQKKNLSGTKTIK